MPISIFIVIGCPLFQRVINLNFGLDHARHFHNRNFYFYRVIDTSSIRLHIGIHTIKNA